LGPGRANCASQPHAASWRGVGSPRGSGKMRADRAGTRVCLARAQPGYKLDTNWIQAGYKLDTNWIQTGYKLDTHWIQHGHLKGCMQAGYKLDTNWIHTGYNWGTAAPMAAGENRWRCDTSARCTIITWICNTSRVAAASLGASLHALGTFQT
jgi:hypothetical protein